MGMTVHVSSPLLARLLAQAAQTPRLEICGLLFGSATAIDDAVACANVSPHPQDSFEIDPQALLAAHRSARGGGPRLIGHYHSHPDGLPIPSARDAQASAGDGALWLILGSGEARCFRAVSGGAVEGAFERVRLDVTQGACAGQDASPQGGSLNSRLGAFPA